MRYIFKISLKLAAMICLITCVSSNSQAFTGKLEIPAEGTTQKIILTDGTTLVGGITEITKANIKFQTDLGEMTIAIEKIDRIEEISTSSKSSAPSTSSEAPKSMTNDCQTWFPNPNRTRLLVGPTARTLKAGDGYFFDLWIFFPGLAYGITDNFMISGGASVIPGADDQMFYITPKYGFKAAEKLDLAVSVTAFRLWKETFYFGLGGMTYGTDNQSITCALGVAFTEEKMADKPAAMLGGEYRFSRRTALVGESWFIPGDKDQGIIGMGALRLMGEQMTIDFGIGLSYDNKGDEVDYYGNPIEDKIDWIPYVDFVWNF